MIITRLIQKGFQLFFFIRQYLSCSIWCNLSYEHQSEIKWFKIQVTAKSNVDFFIFFIFSVFSKKLLAMPSKSYVGIEAHVFLYRMVPSKVEFGGSHAWNHSWKWMRAKITWCRMALCLESNDTLSLFNNFSINVPIEL